MRKGALVNVQLMIETCLDTKWYLRRRKQARLNNSGDGASRLPEAYQVRPSCSPGKKAASSCLLVCRSVRPRSHSKLFPVS
jgi:hypothetical protein